jgi:dihydroneopterin aldolase
MDMSAIQTAAFPLATGFAMAREQAAEPMDLIVVEGFVGETIIGVHTSEAGVLQPVRIDVAVGVPRIFACSTDRLGDTIDYGRIREFLRDLLGHHAHRLLEALAEEIAQRMLADFGGHWARVAVAKPRKFEDVDAVGVIIERRRRVAHEPQDAGEHSMLARLGAGMFPVGDR